MPFLTSPASARRNLSRQMICLCLLLWMCSSLLHGQTSYIMTTVAGEDRVRDGKMATTVPLRAPYGFVQDSKGNIYIADRDDDRVRKVSPDGIISTVAGTGRTGFSGDDGPATEA